MVVDVEPVPLVEAVAVERHRPPVEQVGGEQRDGLLGELVRPEVVDAPGDDDRQRRRCGGTTRAIRSEPAFDAEYGERGSSGSVSFDEPDLDRAVHLVGADVQDPLDLEPAGRVHHDVGAEAVGVDEVVGADDRAVDVALGGEVDDGVVAGHGVLERAGSQMLPLTNE